MTADEIIELIEGMLATFPDRMSGNEVNPLIADKLRPFAESDRPALLEALRKYLSLRVPPSQRLPRHAVPKARLWMALDISEELHLNELKLDIESLVAAVRNGEVLDQLDEKMVLRYSNVSTRSVPAHFPCHDGDACEAVQNNLNYWTGFRCRTSGQEGRCHDYVIRKDSCC